MSIINYKCIAIELAKSNRRLASQAVFVFVFIIDAIPVVMEAIVNAVSHKAYLSNGSVQVMLFSDRLVVMNPGELNPKLSVEELSLPHESLPFNPSIANALYLTRYAENAGSGTTDIIRLCREAGLKDPVYESDHGTFSITIYIYSITVLNIVDLSSSIHFYFYL